jgi:hypothetical protein
MQPLLKEAGIPVRTLLRHLKLNELEGLLDKGQEAEHRQWEIFEKMIATGAYEPPKRMMDHVNMVQFGLDYFMTSEFQSLDEDAQELLKRHIEERAQMAGIQLPDSKAQVPGAGIPGPVPVGGVPAPEAPGGVGGAVPVPVTPEVAVPPLIPG